MPVPVPVPVSWSIVSGVTCVHDSSAVHRRCLNQKVRYSLTDSLSKWQCHLLSCPGKLTILLKNSEIETLCSITVFAYFLGDFLRPPWPTLKWRQKPFKAETFHWFSRSVLNQDLKNMMRSRRTAMKIFTAISWEEVCSTKQFMAGQVTKMIPLDQALTGSWYPTRPELFLSKPTVPPRKLKMTRLQVL